jgi:hypothetical protein
MKTRTRGSMKINKNGAISENPTKSMREPGDAMINRSNIARIVLRRST